MGDSKDGEAVGRDHDDIPAAPRCDACGGYSHICDTPTGCRFFESAYVFFRARDRATMLPDSLAPLLRATEDAAWRRLSVARTQELEKLRVDYEHEREERLAIMSGGGTITSRRELAAVRDALVGFYGRDVARGASTRALAKQAVSDLDKLTGATICPECGLIGEDRECPSCQDEHGGCPTIAISPEAARVFEKLAAQRLGLFDAALKHRSVVTCIGCELMCRESLAVDYGWRRGTEVNGEAEWRCSDCLEPSEEAPL